MPNWNAEIRQRLSGLSLAPLRENAIVEELSQYLDDCYDELLGGGASEAEAYQQTLAELSEGEVLAEALGRVEQQAAEPLVPGEPRRTHWLADLWRDLRFGARGLAKQPGLALIVVLTLALGIGANTTMFSFFNGVLLRPLPYAEPERLVLLDEIATKRGGAVLGASYPDYLDWRARKSVFSEIGSYQEITFTLTGAGEAEELPVTMASDRLFELLGVAPLLGRTFTPEENSRGNHHVIILSHALWRRRFGGDSRIVGRKLTMGNKAWEIVGVMPPGFRFPARSEFWIPMAYSAKAPRAVRGISVLARLKPGVTREQAQSEMSVIARRLAEQYPDSNAGVDVSVTGLRDHLVKDYRRGLWLLLGVVGFVLLIACANVANLLLARAANRHKEMAVRAALGANRWRIARQVLGESLLLGALGGAAGMLTARQGLELLSAVIPIDLPFWMKFSVDGRVLAFTLAVSLLTSLIFGAAPAWQAARVDLIEALKESSGGGGRRRWRELLVVTQIALALILLVGAGLMMRSFLRLQQVRLGFNPDNVLTLRVTVPGITYRGDSAPFFHELVERVNALPGVEVAGANVVLPLTGEDRLWNQGMSVEGEARTRRAVNLGFVTPHYFRALQIPLLSGRVFNDADGRDAPKVAIIDEELARRHWPNASPLGQRIHFGQPENPQPGEWHTIVGVAGSVQHDGLGTTPKNVYVPNLQKPVGHQTLVIRSALPPEALLPAVKSIVKELDANLPITHVATMHDLVAQSVWQPRLYAILFAVFAGVALMLAAVGIYGVMSYVVAARTNELGIRMALGAQPRDVLRLVMGQGMALVAGGVALGWLGAWLLTRLLKTLLFGVSATDPLTFAGVALLLMSVAWLACFLPARRATRLDPLIALRRE